MIFGRSATVRQREGEHAVGAISWGRKGEMRWPDLKERKKRKPERALFFCHTNLKTVERIFH
jgi:hypothetical protein